MVLYAKLDVARYVQQIAGIGQPQPRVPSNIGLVLPRGVYGNIDDVIPPHRPHVAQKGRVQHRAHMTYNEDNADLDGAGATRAIVLPALPPGVKFTITSTIIQSLNLKGMFRGEACDDANQHLMNFVGMC